MGKIKSIFPFIKAPNSHLRDKQSSRAVLAVQKKKKKKSNIAFPNSSLLDLKFHLICKYSWSLITSNSAPEAW